MSSMQWEEYLKYYNEQKRLEEYQQKRKLPRPKTTKITVVLHVALFFMILLIFLMLIDLFDFEIWISIVASSIYIVGVIEFYGRFIVIKSVECYQHYASDEKRRRCKCVPSCSEYAILCLKKYELVCALLKIRKRLFVTCKGFDYIIDIP